MSVSAALGSAVYSKLSGGTALMALVTGVYRGAAPGSAVLPYAVFSLQSGGPLNISPSDMRDELVFVRAYAASPNTAALIDYQASQLLHQGNVAVSGYSNYRTARELDLENTETTPDHQVVFMAGGIYRISLDA